jgi:hypothetical protein
VVSGLGSTTCKKCYLHLAAFICIYLHLSALSCLYLHLAAFYAFFYPGENRPGSGVMEAGGSGPVMDGECAKRRLFGSSFS